MLAIDPKKAFDISTAYCRASGMKVAITAMTATVDVSIITTFFCVEVNSMQPPRGPLGPLPCRSYTAGTSVIL